MFCVNKGLDTWRVYAKFTQRFPTTREIPGPWKDILGELTELEQDLSTRFDAATNTLTVDATATVAYEDVTAPTAAIAPDATSTDDDPVVFTITFDKFE